MRSAQCSAAGQLRDAEASSIAASVGSGVLSEREARWRISALLHGAGIVEQVVRRLCLPRQEAPDLTDSLYDLAYDAIVGVSRPPKLDLARLAAGASFSGWARQFLSSKQACTTARRRSWARARREVLTMDAGRHEPPAATALETEDGHAGEERLDEDRSDAAIASFGAHARGLRPCGRVHLSAATLAMAFQLPHPRRAVDLACRDDLLAVIEADTDAVHSALCHMVDGDDAPAGEDLVHQGVAFMFADWADEQVCTLLGLQPVVSQALAIAALTPVPPPQARYVRQLRRQLVGCGVTPAAARPLATSFAALVAETTASEFDARHALDLKDCEERASDRKRFEAVAEEIIARGWTQLGATPGDVERHLQRMLDQVCYGELAAA